MNIEKRLLKMEQRLAAVEMTLLDREENYTVTPNTLAAQVGKSPKTVRAYLRETWPDKAPGPNNGGWSITSDMAEQVLNHFRAEAVV